MSKIKPPQITLDLLKDESSSESFLRGRDYYRSGSVSNLRLKDNAYIASVAGTYKYEVKITEEDNQTEFSCTCPYDWGGICKHCIAVGLYILNSVQEISVDKKSKKRKGKKLKTEDKFDLTEIFNKATSEQKDDFLMNILKQEQDYKEKFFAAILSQTELETDINIDSIRDNVIDVLEKFDLGNYEQFYDGYDKKYGYRDEWEVLFDGATEELERSLEFVTTKIEKNIKNDNIIEASKFLLGLYEGISLADCYDLEDPACIFNGEFNNQIESFFLYYLGNILSPFFSASKSSQAANRIIDIFFERVQYYTDSTFKEDFNYDLFLFRDFLNILIIDRKTAEYLLSYLGKMKLLDSSTDIVQLQIYKILHNNKKWLSSAEKYFQENTEIAQELLDYYYKNSKKDNFINAGKIVFLKWPKYFDEYLHKKLNMKDDPDFFQKVLFHYAQRTQSLSLFRELKNKFGKQAAKQFIENAKPESLFYINLLDEENEYEKILQFVKKNIDDWHFLKLIKPILNIYPEECLEIIKDKTDEYLKENIGRKYYVKAARWLELLLKIKEPKVKSKIKTYCQELLQKYKMRPALKDELRKVGIK